MAYPDRRDFLTAVAGLGALAAAPASVFASARRTQERLLPRRAIPGTDETLPIVGFGSSKPVLAIPQEGVDPIVGVLRMLLGHGGRVVDTSPRTPDVDTRFGEVLQRPEFRERLFVATKINTPDAETGVAQMRQNQSLFGRRTVDLVQIESLRGLEHHWPRVRAWKESGEARYVGITVSDERNHERMEAFLRRERPDFVHVNYSPVEPAAERRILPLARERGIAVLVNRPFMNGSWFGRVAGRELPAWTADFDCHAWSQLSLKYILANPAVTCVLTETTNPEHMEENIGGGLGRLPDEAQLGRIRDLVSAL